MARPDGAEVALVRRTALVHDVGLVAVPNFILDSPATWSETDFERYRLHPYYTERILSRSDALRQSARSAARIMSVWMARLPQVPVAASWRCPRGSSRAPPLSGAVGRVGRRQVCRGGAGAPEA
jgi:hypothetical protein